MMCFCAWINNDCTWTMCSGRNFPGSVHPTTGSSNVDRWGHGCFHLLSRCHRIDTCISYAQRQDFQTRISRFLLKNIWDYNLFNRLHLLRYVHWVSCNTFQLQIMLFIWPESSWLEVFKFSWLTRGFGLTAIIQRVTGYSVVMTSLAAERSSNRKLLMTLLHIVYRHVIGGKIIALGSTCNVNSKYPHLSKKVKGK